VAIAHLTDGSSVKLPIDYANFRDLLKEPETLGGRSYEIEQAGETGLNVPIHRYQVAYIGAGSGRAALR
jgi:hypothetical protein